MPEYEEKARKLLHIRFDEFLKKSGISEEMKGKIDEKGMFEGLYSQYWGIMSLLLSADKQENKDTSLRENVERLEAELKEIKRQLS